MSNIDDFNSHRYQQFLYIFEELFHTGSTKILGILLPMLFEPPFSQCQIEIITNNAEIIARDVFKHF